MFTRSLSIIDIYISKPLKAPLSMRLGDIGRVNINCVL